MKDQTKEKIRKLELLIRYRIRKMRHPGKVFLVSCVSVLVAGFLGGVALGRYVEGRQAAETVQKKDNQYESLEKEYNSVKEQAEAQFGFLMNAFKYGAPPHGGLAFGLDRLVSMFAGLDSIRDCIAFPKNNSGRDVMLNAPSPLDDSQLDELCILVKPKK